LVIGKHDWASVKERFEKVMGLIERFHPTTDPSEVVDTLLRI